MRGVRGSVRRGLSTALFVWAAACSSAVAQSTPDEAAAREYFERGRVAFDAADYEGALVYFRHAYRLNARGELQYDIGVAASRLQREEEALEAFEHYLEETEDAEREAEVLERIAALRRSIAQRKATERALAEATIRYRTAPPAQELRRISTSAIIGSSILGAVGVAGVTAMGVGLARNGTCTEAVAGSCVTERSTTAWTYVYGSFGLAALAGAATWLGVDARRNKAKRETRVSITPAGLSVSGKF